MKNKKDEMLDSIEGMLGKLVTPEQANSIMGQLTRKPIKDGYTKGEVMTVKEFKELKVGDVIHHMVRDEDSHVRSNEFDIVSEVNMTPNQFGTVEIITEGSYPLYVYADESDDTKLQNYEESSGWTYTISKAKAK